MYTCTLYRRPFDVERGFDRIACQILHFNRSDETEVTTAAAIAGRLARQLPLVVPYTADFEVTGEFVSSHVTVM